MKTADPLDFGTIIVIGGGCYGSYYVRQLGRAAQAGAIKWERVLVIDRNSSCQVATSGALDAASGPCPPPILIFADWLDFFGNYLESWNSDPMSRPSDAIVPSPLMPHLLYDWVRDRAKARWPQRRVETVPLEDAPDTPWQSTAPDGTHYASFATWTCPVNCIEPDICPHTRNDRTWTMPVAIENYVATEGRLGRPLEGPLVFHCTHRAFGVGMIPVSAVIHADNVVAERAEARPARFAVATVSHCHGAINVLAVT